MTNFTTQQSTLKVQRLGRGWGLKILQSQAPNASVKVNMRVAERNFFHRTPTVDQARIAMCTFTPVTRLNNISQPPLPMTELWPMEQGKNHVGHFQTCHTTFYVILHIFLVLFASWMQTSRQRSLRSQQMLGPSMGRRQFP